MGYGSVGGPMHTIINHSLNIDLNIEYTRVNEIGYVLLLCSDDTFPMTIQVQVHDAILLLSTIRRT